MIAAANQHLVTLGLRFNSSIIAETGQAASPHDIATLLGFGASAICPVSIHNRVITHYDSEQAQQNALNNFQKGVAKSLMKTMGKFGLCTAESYIGGEFLNLIILILRNLDSNLISPIFILLLAVCVMLILPPVRQNGITKP